MTTTIDTIYDKIVSYTGNGSATEFTTDNGTKAFLVFSKFNSSYHTVTVKTYDSVTDATLTLVEGTDYTVTLAGTEPAIATVTLVTAPASTTSIYLISDLEMDQRIDFNATGRADLDAITNAFSKVTLFIQQLSAQADELAVTISDTSGVDGAEIPVNTSATVKVLTTSNSLISSATIDSLVSIDAFDVSALTASTAILGTDHLPFYDVSGSDQFKATIADIVETGMLALTTVAEVDTVNDLVPIKDATDGTMKFASAALFGGAGPDGSLKSVQAATKTDSETIASPSDWTDVTGLSVTVTPASIKSVILLSTSISFEAASAQRVSFRISKGERNIDLLSDKATFSIPAEGDVSVNHFNGGAIKVFFSVVDTADTLENITYKVQVKSANAGNLIINGEQTTTDSDTISRSACQLTMIEVL